jgi:hypothetical protein
MLVLRCPFVRDDSISGSRTFGAWKGTHASGDSSFCLSTQPQREEPRRAFAWRAVNIWTLARARVRSRDKPARVAGRLDGAIFFSRADFLLA